MLLKKGSKGDDVKKLQAFLRIGADGDFGSGTEAAVKAWQTKNGLSADGIVGDKTWAKMFPPTDPKIPVSPKPAAAPADPAEKWKNKTIEGSTFPDKPYSSTVAVKLNAEMVNEYLPALKKIFPNGPKGFQLLLTVMAYHEGFSKGSRSYRTNNPGNIGNVDSGANQSLATLADGILRQKTYVENIVAGKNKSYPMGKEVTIKPYYSEEIAKNAKTYGMSPWLPGYHFTFSGQIDQFVKIYSTGARGGNSYINTIVSYFNQNGIKIAPDSKIQDVIQMN